MSLFSPELRKALAPALTAIVIEKAHAVHQRIDEADPSRPLLTVAEIEGAIGKAESATQASAAFAPKKWSRSRGVLAGLAIAALSGGGVFWETLQARDIAEIIHHLDAILIAVLGLGAVWGRIKARRAIG